MMQRILLAVVVGVMVTSFSLFSTLFSTIEGKGNILHLKTFCGNAKIEWGERYGHLINNYYLGEHIVKVKRYGGGNTLRTEKIRFGDYEFVAKYECRKCGKCYDGTKGYEVYKNGALIEKKEPYENGKCNYKNYEGKFNFSGFTLDVNLIDEDFVTAYCYRSKCCGEYRFINGISSKFDVIFDKPLLDYEVEVPETKYYFEEENFTIKLKFKKVFTTNYLAQISLEVCQPAVWGGKTCKTFDFDRVELKDKESIVSVRLPLKTPVERIWITPKLKLWVDASFINDMTDGKMNVKGDELVDKYGKSCCRGAGCKYNPFGGYEKMARGAPYVGLKWCVDNGYKYFYLGDVTLKTKEVMVVPKPLYVEVGKDGTCPAGYHLSPNHEYCLRDDLKELSCLQLGCPVVPDHTYICTSSGICAEIVYVYQDCRQLGCPEINGTKGICDPQTGVCLYKYKEYINITCRENPNICPPGSYCDKEKGICVREKVIEKEITCKENPYICPPGTICDIETGACVKTEIKEELIQCKKDSDCYIPCEGVTAKCVNNYCEYSGSCKPTYVDCKVRGCPEGYICTEAGVCIKTVEKRCKSNKDCPEGTLCDLGTGLCVLKKKEEVFVGCTRFGCPEGFICDAKHDVCIKYYGITCRENPDICPEGTRCDYNSGACVLLKEIKVGCKELGCPEGYYCDEERNVCVRKEEGINIEEMLKYIIYGAVIIGLIVVFIKK